MDVFEKEMLLIRSPSALACAHGTNVRVMGVFGKKVNGLGGCSTARTEIGCSEIQRYGGTPNEIQKDKISARVYS